MAIVRYGLGGAMIVGGVVMIVLNPSGLGVDGFDEQERHERRERGSAPVRDGRRHS